MLHNIPARPDAVAFKISGNHAVIPNQGKSLYNCLPVIALIRQGFQIPCHACGKHYFRQHFSLCPKAAALKYFSVFQHQISGFPHTSLPFCVSSKVYMLSLSVYYDTGKPAPAQDKFAILFFHQKFSRLFPCFCPFPQSSTGRRVLKTPAR